ncbi:hypothetical protein TSUD_55040 [Trifolium subterraneum]|uniref:Integrase catalytic domain-containing protein n=1 Tax=Trifolium subterraneum TaxID=3900 RepID=A0A2Z6MEJ8_TRISU|nr:hypothetical protein TSUD_55040 [Trifolium subterraneum]
MAEETKFLHTPVPKFDGYYEHWPMLMENISRSKELWSLIEVGVTVAPANAIVEQQQVADASKHKDLKVKNYLFQSIDRSILETILVRETSKDIWDAMKRKYQGSTKVKRAHLQALMRKFEILAMKESESVNEYFARTLAIANKMSTQGETMQEVAVVEKILRSLLPKFNYVVSSIEEANDINTLSIDGLQSCLIVQEQRMKAQTDNSEEQALKVSYSANGGRGSGRGRGRNSTNGARGRGRGRQSNELVECFKFHKLGHYQNECTEWEGNAHYASYNDDEEMVLMAKTDLEFNSKNEAFYLDSGCINHMIGQKEWFFNFDSDYRDSVKLGDDSRMTVMGKGSVKLKINNVVHIISNVYYVPRLKTNLLSIGQLQQKQLTVVFKNDMLKKMVRGLPDFEEVEDKCDDCLAGKQHKEAIPKKTWVYVLKEKSSAFEVFKSFKALIENESGCNIQCLRTDRGGEYTSNAFNEFCIIKGIKRQLTAAYTPQQNGVSERKNRTLLNTVRSMINARNVPKRFWPEAVKWATYVMNRSPTPSVKDMTPEEAWSGKTPSVHYFKTFGCLAHAYVHDSQRKKLDNKSKKCVLLGVSEESKAYKLYDPIDKKIIISRDVIFDESKSWNSENSNQQTNSNDIWEHVSDNNSIQHNTAEVNVEAENQINENVVIEDTSSESENEGGTPQPVSQTRIRKPSVRLTGYVTGREVEEDEELHNLAVFNTNEDPSNYQEVVKLDVWRKARDPEMELVAKGYTQKHGIYYNEVFAPVARWDTIRIILACAASKGWMIFQLDFKSVFLHGELAEDIYVSQPLGYESENEGMVYKLKKALYGLKQSPRAWYSKIESYFAEEKFEKFPYEHTLFVKYGTKEKNLVVSLYVDDLIYTGNDQTLMNEFKSSMKRKFAMTDLGKMRYFLGVEVNQTLEGIFMHHQKYANKILVRFGMESSNSVCSPIVPGCKLTKNENGKAAGATSYKHMVRCLMYLLASRPDLAYYVCLVARYMDRPTKIHMAAIKRILRYLKGTMGFGIMYKVNTDEYALKVGVIQTMQETLMTERAPLDLTKDGKIELVHCRTDDQLADILTKPLKLESFYRLREGLGMIDVNTVIA